ncbi:hypothetical protein GEMRC1_012926 [Eukaryota sp. GEM-RC1]
MIRCASFRNNSQRPTSTPTSLFQTLNDCLYSLQSCSPSSIEFDATLSALVNGLAEYRTELCSHTRGSYFQSVSETLMTSSAESVFPLYKPSIPKSEPSSPLRTSTLSSLTVCDDPPDSCPPSHQHLSSFFEDIADHLTNPQLLPSDLSLAESSLGSYLLTPSSTIIPLMLTDLLFYLFFLPFFFSSSR